MALNPVDIPQVRVRTTSPIFPLPPVTERPALRTERLVLRPLMQCDLVAYNKIRQQREFMNQTALGKTDANIEETQQALDQLIQPPNSHFYFGIFSAETDELIGDCGIHTLRSGEVGWPVIGYKLSKENWGYGYATEAMRAVLEAWWQFPRHDVEVNIHRKTLRRKYGQSDSKTGAPIPAKECCAADVIGYNKASQGVLKKLGFEYFATWDEEETQLDKLGQILTLDHYVLLGPSPSS
ncbi:acetyltransferase domain-containing protein [Xylariaceae sp. FL0255]|nr:acetyltransferase domain-containing protein [Xylariaceae sp. FL0255]